ncbi:MAG TPA: CpsD/CapB family tyrosine-protein kinase [Candidatus Acidoferrum sp.]|nr:CpsD/CapB family tyrosine-protein kinase [Candidatus Acidoferrum sp.]
MSKNFELLQQIGSDEDLFRTAVESRGAATLVDHEEAPVLDQETFERLMEKASLMGLFQASNEPSQQTFPKEAEISLDVALESSPGKPACGTTGEAFRTSRNPTSPIGDLMTVAEGRETQCAAQAASLPNRFQLNKNATGASHPASQEPLAVPRVHFPKKAYANISLPRRWLDSLKHTAKRWEWNDGVRSNHGGPDLEAITREQEIKLVERVFPGAAAESPRVALFAGLENEAQCATTCARVAELLAARAEGPVCVVDANFHTPSLHEYFGVDNLKGLAEATVESGPVRNFAQQLPEPDLWLITAGRAAAQLRFPAMADGLRVRIEELRETFRYVVIHSAPLRLETRAMLLSRWTDGVVLVVEAHATRKDVARRAKGMLEAANVSLLGVVLKNRTFPIPEAIYRRL